MTVPTLHRRSFITGLVALVAAPAIVRAGSLMPVKVMVTPEHILDHLMCTISPPLLNMDDGIWELNYDYAMNQIVRILHVPEQYLVRQ